MVCWILDLEPGEDSRERDLSRFMLLMRNIIFYSQFEWFTCLPLAPPRTSWRRPSAVAPQLYLPFSSYWLIACTYSVDEVMITLIWFLVFLGKKELRIWKSVPYLLSSNRSSSTSSSVQILDFSLKSDSTVWLLEIESVSLEALFFLGFWVIWGLPKIISGQRCYWVWFYMELPIIVRPLRLVIKNRLILGNCLVLHFLD